MPSIRDTVPVPLPRRMALGLTGAALLTAAPAAARAAFVRPPDVVVFCDPALRGVMRRLGAQFASHGGAPIRMKCAPARLMAAQLVRHERCDIIVTLSAVIAQMQAGGVVRPQPAVGSWRNRLLIARSGPGPGPGQGPGQGPGEPSPATPDRLPALLAGRKLGVPDPGPNAVVDSAALIARLGLERALEGRVVGEVDTEGVAWSLARGRVGLGLLLSTETGDGLFPAVSIPDAAYPPVRYQAAFNRHVLSRNAAAFMRFIARDEARESLTQSGLEVEA